MPGSDRRRCAGIGAGRWVGDHRGLGVALGVAVAVWAPWARPADGQICFGQRSVTDDLEGAIRVASGDLDGDGDLDVLAASGMGNRISWYENLGINTAEFEERPIDESVAFPVAAVLADLDGDDDLDAVTCEFSADRLVWYENLGGTPPTFARRDIPAQDIEPLDVAVGDFNGDGAPDLAAAFFAGDRFSWFESDGGSPPTFTERVISDGVMNGPTAVAAGDLDGDGDDDLVGGVGLEHRIMWFENEPGALGQPPSFAPREITNDARLPVRVIIEDLDTDGDEDVLAANAEFGRVEWYESDGAGDPGFTGRLIFEGAQNVRGLAVADLNGDLAPDVVSASPDDDSVRWYASDGAQPPSFGVSAISVSLLGASSVAEGDFDGDGREDVVVSAFAEGAVAWFENGVEATNQTSGQSFALLDEAIAAAIPGDDILADPGQFSCGCTKDLDYLGKAITIASAGDLRRDAGATTTLAPGSTLEALGGETVIDGVALLPDGARIAASGGSLRVVGELEIPAGADGFLDGSEVSLLGLVRLAPGARLLAPTLFISAQALLAYRPIDESAVGAYAAHAADLDDDGDLDVVAALQGPGEVALYERLPGAPGDPPAFARRAIASGIVGLTAVTVADLDGDGDDDVIASAINSPTPVVWLQNAGGLAFVRRDVPVSVGSVRWTHAHDLDRDGDEDLAIADWFGDTLAWLENDGPGPLGGIAFVERIVLSPTVGTGEVDGPRSVHAGDVNGDGRPDLLTASFSDSRVAWYENTGGDPPVFEQRTITTSALGAHSVVATDVDDDGDLDALVAAFTGDRVSWFDNQGGASPSFVERTIGPDVRGASRAIAHDMDADGDLDVVTGSVGDGTVRWFENDDGSPPAFAERIVDRDVVEPWTVFAADIDGDGDADILSASSGDDTVAWYESRFATSIELAEAGSSIDVAGDATIDNRAVLRVGADAELRAGGTVGVRRGSGLAGAGVVRAGELASAGVIRPDAAQALTVEGAYRQSFDDGPAGEARGELRVVLDNVAPASRLDVVGPATLAGSLVAAATPGFAPGPDDTFTVLNADSLGGTRFGVALLPNAGAQQFLSVEYEDDPSGRAGARVFLQVNRLSEDVALDPQAAADPGASGAPRGATLADLDVDGDLDLILALPSAVGPTTEPGSVVVLFNEDDGDPGNGWEGFGGTLQIFEGVGVEPTSVAVGLLDGDDTPDLAVTNAGDDTVSIILVQNLLANDFLTYEDEGAEGLLVPVGGAPADLIIEDLDGDGLEDLATANFGGDSVSILTNAGQGVGPSWELVDPDEIELPGEDECPLSIRPGETSAGIVFMVTANAGNDTIGLILINPDGTATALPNIPTDRGPTEVVVADFDGDGSDDAATVNGLSSSVSVSLNETTPGGPLTLGPTTSLPIGSADDPPRSIDAGDLDDDGDADLAILVGDSVRVLRNDLTGGQLVFAPAAVQPAGDRPLLVRTGDLDGDGREDVVAVSESLPGASRGGAGGGSVRPLLAVEPCAGDVNGDGVTNVFDFAELAARFGDGPGMTRAQGDLNGDGFVDVEDYMTLAEDFGCGTE
jgi:hypothetical protein